MLAVVWSAALGEKKSELVDAVSKLKVDRETLERLRKLGETVVSGKMILDAEAAVRAGENAVARIEDTLRAWRLPKKEIEGLVAEAERLGSGQARRELTAGKTWARVEIRAPFAGVILERNTNVRDVVDTAADLFRLADLSKLTVWAQVYEDDLPTFLALKRPHPWDVRLPARPDFKPAGRLEHIGDIIDPLQHTALARGTVDNADGSLRVGQFVTVTVAVEPRGGEVEIPTAALVEDGTQSVVFVRPDPADSRFVRRTVEVSRRQHDVVYLTPPSALGGVRPGEQVVVGGAIQLNQVLTDAGPTAAAKK